MTRTDHIFALTATTLAADHKSFDACVSQLADSYEINEVRKINAVSLGASIAGEDQPLATWLSQLKQSRVISVQCMHYYNDGESIPAHIAAAFSGGMNLLMRVATEAGSTTYLLNTFHSSRYDITTADFSLLLDRQRNPSAIWSRAYNLIIESNRLNGRAVFEPPATRAYLESSEGLQVFGYLVDNLVKEIQIEIAINDQDFVIPETLSTYFIKYNTPSFFTDDVEHVYLYPLQHVTSEQLLQLVAAQGFGDETWEATNKLLMQYAEPETPPIAVNEWERSIQAMEPVLLNRYAHTVCRGICELCESKTLKPVIPGIIKEYFGPDETDQKRAAMRSQIDSKGWQLQASSKPWEYYRFLPVGLDVTFPHADPVATRAAFKNALQTIYTFATRVQSSYAEAFGLSLLILSEKFPAGIYDEAHVKLIADAAKAHGFSDHAIEHLAASAWIGSSFSKIGWSDERILDLLAVNLSDVFGGMGSWNDQYFDNEQVEYAAVTAKLFDKLKQHFMAVISNSTPFQEDEALKATFPTPTSNF